MAVGDPAVAAAESARVGELFANGQVGDFLSLMPPAERSAAMVALMSAPGITPTW